MVRDVKFFNLTLSHTWVWRWLRVEDSLWAKILMTRYDSCLYDNHDRNNIRKMSLW